jgi:hypothetical protein
MPTEGWEGDIGNHDWGGFVSAQSPDPASGLLSQEASIRAAADRALSLRIDLGISASAVSGLAFISLPNVFTEVNKIPGIRVGTVAVGSDHVMSDTDFEVLVDANAGDVLITLPAATGTGQYYRVKKIDDTVNIVTVQADGTDLIDDSNLIALTDQWSDCTLIDAATGYWDNAGSGAAGDTTSVTSSEVAGLVQIASAAATSADNHANTVSGRVVSVSAELASLVQIVSANVVSVEAHVNTVSAAGAFANAHADIVSARLVSVSAELNSLLNSVESRLSTRIDTASGTGGGGSITSQEVSVLVQTASAAATSADAHANTVSARVVSVSAELASLVQIASAAATSADGHANTASAAATSADNHANTVSVRAVSISAELGSLVQIASAAATSADAHANTVSGRVVSVSAELVSLLASAINTVSTRQTGNYPFGIQVSAGIATGKLPGYWTCPYNGTIRAWNLTVDTGTITVKIRKKTTGTAAPLSADWINTNGIAISANTNIRSSTLTDFTNTGVSIGDVFACDVVAVSGGTTDFAGSLEIVKT